MCWYGTKILVVVLGNIHILCAFGLLGESNPSLSVSFEEHDLQDLEKIALVRTEKSQSPLDLHHRRPRHKICSIFILTEVGLATCGAYCPGTKARLITHVRLTHLHGNILTVDMMCNVLHNRSVHLVSQK